MSEDALAGQAAEAGTGDVHGGLVGGQAEEFAEFAGSKRLLGVIVEHSQDALASLRGRLGWRCASGAGQALDDLPSGGQLGETTLCLGKSRSQLPEPAAQAVGVRRGPFGPLTQEVQEFGDVHAALSNWSCQGGVGVVSLRSMPAVETQ
ncbi:hypothetical protein [Streptomyces sp. NPDC058385]|uniref:hypothetical protein n=1 Tax=Streptomyces sp. NPDC058385 TaxID=3346473 RepID=UPI0036607563